jgi:Na+/H+ antiporter NhaD/arsenite permease-like protein
MLRAAIIFLAVYTGLVVSKRHRPLVAWSGVVVALVIGALRPSEIVLGINWNVVGIFVGSLVLAELFIFSRVPEAIADHLINRSPNVGVAFLFIIAVASVMSIFMDNVVTVLISAPIAIQLARKADVSPVPVIVGIAISSNLQGMAILIGDTPSMILAARMRMNFLDFFVYKESGLPGIFWLVQLGAVVGLAVLYRFVKDNKHKPQHMVITPVRSWMPVWLVVVMVVVLSFAMWIDEGFTWYGGTVCMVIGLIGLLWYGRRKRMSEARHLLLGIDWGTVSFLAAVFVLVYMLERRGAVDALIARLAVLSNLHPFLVFSIVVWFSVMISAFIDNVPYIIVMLPVVIGISGTMSVRPELLVFGVLIGSCMGGNITPIGASANLVCVGILEREGRHVSFGSFVRIGLPFTVAATVVSYLVLYLIYH